MQDGPLRRLCGGSRAAAGSRISQGRQIPKEKQKQRCVMVPRRGNGFPGLILLICIGKIDLDCKFCVAACGASACEVAHHGAGKAPILETTIAASPGTNGRSKPLAPTPRGPSQVASGRGA